MELTETWGISPERIRAFFGRQPDVEPVPEGFRYRDCQIRLTPLPDTPLGKWNFSRTRVEMRGSPEAVEQIHRRFFLEFLSAGG